MLLSVDKLVTSFKIEEGVFRAVDEVSFSLDEGEIVGLVGESGCGKSVTALSILKLIGSPPGFIESGKVKFEDEDLVKLDEQQMRQLRGNHISMIFQEPMTSLNPVFTVGNQISKVLRIHQGLTRNEAKEKSIEMLRFVKIPAPNERFTEYPHQLSGGMRQRVMIAMALACRPKLLIADEPTTALDVTIQAQILDLMISLQKELNMAILLITHDLGVVAQTCNRVMVMYGGCIVEEGPTRQIFNDPKHPYTVGLLNSVPKLGKKTAKLETISGSVPSLGKFPVGCRFQNRCPLAEPNCRDKEPSLRPVGQNHNAACWLA